LLACWTLLGFLISSTVLLVDIAPASATVPCGNFISLQEGYDGDTTHSQPAEYQGVAATITDAGGYVLCTTDTSANNFSTSWVMIAGQLPSYEQAGIMYRYGGVPGPPYCPHKWAEEKPPGAPFKDYYVTGYPCSAVGEAHQYWVQAVNGVMRDNMSTTIIHQSVFNYSQMGTPLTPEFTSETNYITSHIAGTATTPQDYSNTQVQGTITGNFYPTSGNVNLTPVNQYPQGFTHFAQDEPCCAHTRSWWQ
jgi:hypothetical protein